MNKSESKYFNTAAKMDEAFLKLLEQKDFAYITVKELCDRAGINRTTFYNHYSSPTGVLEKMAADYIDDIGRTLGKEREEVRANVAVVFSYMETHIALTRILLSSPFNDSFLERLFALPKVADLLSRSIRHVTDENEKRAVISFALSGSYKLIKDWITSDERISATDEAVLVLSLARRVCCSTE